VIHVDAGRDNSDPSKKTLAANLRFAENLGAKVVQLKGLSVADSVAKVVREKHITHVIFGRSVEHGWKKYLYLSAAHRFLRESPEVDVHIVTQEKD
jgi:two-component system sensor histidine kinase KdpD